ncbi:cation diffusion facilitator family transporter [Roseicella frigidaeris]|uniref:cation diffusion facilitator family transporter n=1 Tax=Roseicella frigidaeris TaxID=2230885 RepID=UPI00140406D5|nr:cation transporter [Roseicella frigidaeris]
MQIDDNRREQRVLAWSIGITTILAAIGIACGLFANSSSILFDGLYSLIDAAMTALALGVSVLLSRGSSRHFQFGFWHLEPMLVLLNSVVLALSCGYAFLGALNDLFRAGRGTDFGPGLLYVVGAGLAEFSLWLAMRRQARRLGSDLIALDARAWLISGLLSIGLGLSFGLGLALHGTEWAGLIPYLDPAILAVMALLLLPVPLAACWRAGKDILEIAPSDLDERVRAIAQGIAERHGFHDFTSYVAKTGRARFVDITFLAGPELGSRPLGYFDGIRGEIAAALEARPPSHWLNIEFTSERRWL